METSAIETGKESTAGETRRLRPAAPGAGPALAAALLAVLLAPAASADPERCLAVSGRQALRCLHRSAEAIERCRRRLDSACETTVRSDGTLDALRAATEAPIRAACSEADAVVLGYTGLQDLVDRIPQACDEFTEDLLQVAYTDDPFALSAPDAILCQNRVARNLRRSFARTARANGPLCNASDFANDACDRSRRDALVADGLDRVDRRLLFRCGAALDGLGLSTRDPPATREERLDEVLERVTTRSRHYALRVYPPNNLGPAADPGPFPVGVTTLNLLDASRRNVAGTGPRPVTVEVWYPSTPSAVAGVPREVVQILGVDVIEVPAFRDVALAPGTARPLVLFSHGNGGVRTQSFFLTSHLASHGFLVASPDHHGNNLVDLFSGIVDALSAVNRPLDLSFVIDEMLVRNATPGDFFESAIDPTRIAAAGHSFGGFTVFALAGGAWQLGTFTDSRVQAILPLAPGGASALGEDFFGTVTVPTLIVGGSLDETTPFDVEQQVPFDNLPSFPIVVGLAEIANAGHFTFSDICEIPPVFAQFTGGLDEACEPRHLPWRHAQDIVRFLAFHFLNGILTPSPSSIATLTTPELVEGIEDLRLESK